MCLLIWTVFSGEQCGPWASCFPVNPVILYTVLFLVQIVSFGTLLSLFTSLCAYPTLCIRLYFCLRPLKGKLGIPWSKRKGGKKKKIIWIWDLHHLSDYGEICLQWLFTSLLLVIFFLLVNFSFIYFYNSWNFAHWGFQIDFVVESYLI